MDKAKLKIDEITRRQQKRHLNDSSDSRYDNKDDKTYSSNNYSNKRQTYGGDDQDNDSGSCWKRKSSNDSRGESNFDKDKYSRDYNSSSNDNRSSRDYNSSYNDQNGGYKSNNNRDYNSRDNDNGYSNTSYNSWSNNNDNKQRATNSDDWGGWGKKVDEGPTVDSLIFRGNDQPKTTSRFSEPAIESYVPDDDWGIPTYMEEEKPIRKRPENAQLKMKSQKDSNFYPVHRNFYREHPNIARMTTEEKDKFLLEKNNIMIKEIESETGASFCNFGNTVFEKDPEELIDEIPIPKIVPKPVTTFDEAFFNHPDILKEIRKQKFEEPSPIQCISWPILMTGRDFIGIAQTGTGKTLAFLLPAFIHIEGQPK